MTIANDETRAAYEQAVGALSPDDAAILQRANEIASRMLSTGMSVTNAATAYAAIQHKFQHFTEEHFGVLWMDAQNNIIVFEELFTGTINSCSVPPRVVVKRALELNAAACIFAHNHPSGTLEASEGDVRLTQNLCTILNIVDVHVLDHIIVGRGAYQTFRW